VDTVKLIPVKRYNMVKQKNKNVKDSKKPFNYRERHAVIIEVDSEKEQKRLYETFKKQGFKRLKIVSV
jgi:hypothetical protein